jgi:hypothetical protein
MSCLKPDCRCALRRKASAVASIAAEQCILCSPVCRAKIAKYGHVSRIGGKSRRTFSAVKTCWRWTQSQVSLNHPFMPPRGSWDRSYSAKASRLPNFQDTTRDSESKFKSRDNARGTIDEPVSPVRGTQESDRIASLARAQTEVRAGAVLPGSRGPEHQAASAVPQPTNNTD